MRYLQLTHNEWDPVTKTSRPKVLHSFGREDQLVNHRRTTIGATGVIGVGGSRNYGEHGSYPSDRRWSADLA